MARQLTQVIAELRREVRNLASQKDKAESRVAQLNSEVETLQSQLDECRRDLETALQEVDFLTVSHRIADNPEHIISARRRVQRLIAKIDKCVNLLRDDADFS